MRNLVLRLDPATGRDPEQRSIELCLSGARTFLENEPRGPAAYLLPNDDLDTLVHLLTTLGFDVRDQDTQKTTGKNQTTVPLQQTFASVRAEAAAVRCIYASAGRALTGAFRLIDTTLPGQVKYFFFLGVPKHIWKDLLAKKPKTPRSDLELWLRRQYLGYSRGADGVRSGLIRYSNATVPVLITGPTGTGKEVIAKLIHRLSRRRGAFLGISCANMTESLIDSLLFGHVRGAFTGAALRHHGFFERTNGGTFFLDEIAELPLWLQAKLLRVIQEGEFEPVGSEVTLSVDVRIVAATHENLKELVEQGKFREDLYYRLCGPQIFTPPLAGKDIDLQVHRIWAETEEARGITLPRAVMDKLRATSWPGNVRQLEQLLRTLALDAPYDGATPEAVDRIHFQQENGRPAIPLHHVEPEVDVLSQFDSLRDEYLDVADALESFYLSLSRAVSARSAVRTHTQSADELALAIQSARPSCPLSEVPDVCRVCVVVDNHEALQALVGTTAHALTLPDPSEAEAREEADDEQAVLHDLELPTARFRVRVGANPSDELGPEFTRLSDRARELWVDVEITTVFQDEWEETDAELSAASTPAMPPTPAGSPSPCFAAKSAGPYAALAPNLPVPQTELDWLTVPEP